MWILASASVARAGASRTARGIAGQGGTLSKILRAGAVAIPASATQYRLEGIARAAETPARATERRARCTSCLEPRGATESL